MFNLSNETDYKLLSKTKNYYNFFILVILSLFTAISIRLVFLSFDNTNSSTSILRETSLSALPTIYDINKNRLAYSDYNYSVKNIKNKEDIEVFAPLRSKSFYKSLGYKKIHERLIEINKKFFKKRAPNHIF